MSHSTAKITTLPPRMIHDAAEGLPSCYFRLLEKELMVDALEEHIGKQPQVLPGFIYLLQDAFLCQVNAPCSHPACSMGSQLSLPGSVTPTGTMSIQPWGVLSLCCRVGIWGSQESPTLG